jgi:hypothetical protein
MLSCVLILPEDQVATGNAVGEAMGWGPNNYSVPLSPTGAEPATHYGLHAWTDDAFKELVESGVYAPELEQAGISKADYDAMHAVLVSSFWSDYVDHFNTVCAEQGLEMVTFSDNVAKKEAVAK